MVLVRNCHREDREGWTIPIEEIGKRPGAAAARLRQKLLRYGIEIPAARKILRERVCEPAARIARQRMIDRREGKYVEGEEHC